MRPLSEVSLETSIGFDPYYEVIKNTHDVLLTRLPTIGSFSMLFKSNEKTKMSSFVFVFGVSKLHSCRGAPHNQSPTLATHNSGQKE